jgi:hypothetical protein
MPVFNTTAWVIGAEDGDLCSASADTVVIQSDDEDHHANHIVFAGSLESLSHKASSKKAAAMCEACDEGIVTVATCLSGNQKLCETCDLATWVAGLCSACCDCPVLPQAQKKCPDQHLCYDCDRDRFIAARLRNFYYLLLTYTCRDRDLTTPEASSNYWSAEYVHACSECTSRPAMGQTEYVRNKYFRDCVVCVPLCSAYLCDVCDLERWVQRHGIW